MTPDMLHIKKFLFICILLSGSHVYCQDTLRAYIFDTTFFNQLKTQTWTRAQEPFDYLHQSPDKDDKRVFKKYAQLATQQPTSKSYDKYYQLARALWELNKLSEAEQMFLHIINSTEKQYTTTYYHASDVRGDTTTNIYGYGSYTSSYKNSAAIYLTKIYILNKQFDKAYKYLEDAVNKYKVTYNCGTGYRWQKNEYDFLYGCCYEGLQQYDKVLALLLPECLNRNDEIIVRVIRKLYSQNEIKDYLNKAENSLQCEFDTFPSYSYETYSSGKKTEKTDTLTYYSGSATINLFNKTVNMPHPHLENGERITSAYFIREFRESSFYFKLAEIAGIAKQQD